MPDILKPDMGKIVWLLVGVLVVPKVMTIVTSRRA